MTNPAVAHPPATLEGWYVLHQIFRAPRGKGDAGSIASLARRARASLGPARGGRARKVAPSSGWSCYARLIGSASDLMAIHFRDSLDDLARVQDAFGVNAVARELELTYSFLSITEAGLYHITAELARDAVARGGAVGDAEYARALGDRAAAERGSAHIRRRLYPELPANMPYVCFYPMSKRRDEGQNWYTLSLDERSRLMYAHGLTGRRYAGKVQQVISGAIGLDAWEWAVTLFGGDPLDFKKLVTDMRFDEVSAKYAVFGDFYVGRLIEP
jgi:chlorite dismutase